MSTAARPDAVRKDCRHWIGAESRYCRSGDGVRHYLPGHRCKLHTPAALQGKPEPQPGPGWPSLKPDTS
ncbi:hypothetical protein HRW07_10060 [Streptomyces lunaelactis]|uniref:hypothetical protein n=1 Tax=Streptomyces lunaelactis TaxID=1535768 RepID=UPI00158476C0|nr:hypothetical protein [Streptomyces lunaelactis]NUL03572.1 hypothetical protein [Streptomyces lunaelactis]